MTEDPAGVGESEQEENVYEPIEKKETSAQQKSASRERPRQVKTTKSQKLKRAHHYENVPSAVIHSKSSKRSPVARNETYLIRRSVADLYAGSHATADSLDNNRMVYRSCQSLGQSHRYPNAPQKVTTLTSPGEPGQSYYRTNQPQV